MPLFSLSISSVRPQPGSDGLTHKERHELHDAPHEHSEPDDPGYGTADSNSLVMVFVWVESS